MPDRALDLAGDVWDLDGMFASGTEWWRRDRVSWHTFSSRRVKARQGCDEPSGRSGSVCSTRSAFHAVAVTDQREVFALGMVEGEAEDLAGVPCELENCPDEHLLIAIDRGDFGCLDVFMAPR